MGWREQIEEIISGLGIAVTKEERAALRAVLDVAVAAEGVSWPGPTLEGALDKLREVGDE